MAWERWWDFNRDPYLDFGSVLRRIHPETGRPGDARVDPLGARRAGLTHGALYGEVVPALRTIVRDEEDTRLLSGALLALARIGDRPEGHEPPAPFAPDIAVHLKHANRAVGETAILALGVLGSLDAATLLADLAGDTEAGRAACDASRVPARYRTFAAYALGLVGEQASQPEVARFAVHHLAEILTTDAARYADLQAACVIAMGLARAPEGTAVGGDDARPSTTLEAQVGHLLAILADEDSGKAARAFVPTSLARLLAGTTNSALKDRVARDLMRRADKRKKEDDAVRRSAIVALGRIGDGDDDSIDASIRDALMANVGVNDVIGRQYAVLALAEAAGRKGTGDVPHAGADAAARFLTDTLARGKSRLKPWAGIALGVLGNGLRQDGRLLARGAADALLHRTGDSRAASDSAAYAIGAALVGDNRARKNVVERLHKVHSDEHRAALLVALGLMGDRSSLSTMTAFMDGAHHHPQVMEQAAIGRALLGDDALVTDLLERLKTCDCYSSTLGVCRALAWTGDARALPPLLALLGNERLSALERSAAADALGWIGDRSELPWRSHLSVGLNYVGAPATLTDPSGFGVLDTL